MNGKTNTETGNKNNKNNKNNKYVCERWHRILNGSFVTVDIAITTKLGNLVTQVYDVVYDVIICLSNRFTIFPAGNKQQIDFGNRRRTSWELN